jgi:hypothetical protein
LRLLERYLHRYSNPTEGIIDGAVYAFAAGTNPEVFILLECRESGDKMRQWYFGATRLSAGALDAKFDDQLVWDCPPIERWDPRKPYWSGAFAEADLVDDPEAQQPGDPARP